MSVYRVRRKLKSYTVEASTSSKAKYRAYLEYKRSARRPMTFKEFFIAVSRVQKLED